jgi:hypothetical protein
MAVNAQADHEAWIYKNTVKVRHADGEETKASHAAREPLGQQWGEYQFTLHLFQYVHICTSLCISTG